MGEWGEQFSKVQPILNYLSSYPIMLEKTRFLGIFVSSGIEEKQLEWISLFAQLVHPLDKKIFKPYWVPVFEENYEFFMDISDPNYLIFEVLFFWLKSFDYHEVYVFFEIDKVLANFDEDEDYIHEIFRIYENSKCDFFVELFDFYEEFEKQIKYPAPGVTYLLHLQTSEHYFET